MQRPTKRAKSDASVAFQRTYVINTEALRLFLKTRDANVIVPLVQNHPNTLRSREIVERLLGTVNANGCCHAQYKYSSKYNECELYKYGLSHSRVYAVDKYSCAFACLPQKNQKLRSLALNRDYYAFDLSKCYHYIGLGLTQNEETRKVLQYFVDKADEIMNDVATFYGVDLKTTKEWFHAFSNNKQIANWQRENDIDTTHEFIVTWVATQNNVTSEMCALYPTAHAALGRQAATLRAYINQDQEAKARQAMEGFFNECDLGPPMHDGISVRKHAVGESPDETAQRLSEVVSRALRYKMVVHHEVMETVEMQTFKPPRFSTDLFSTNRHCKTVDALQKSLASYREMLSEYFVTILRGERPTCVELTYRDDEPDKFIIRSKKNTCEIYSGMLIATEAHEGDDGVVLGGYKPLLQWYLSDVTVSKNYDQIGFYPHPDEALRHPNVLNICAPLPFDGRFKSEELAVGSGPAFVDPWGDAPEPDWRTLDDVSFVLWHLRYNLCGGDGAAFAYTLQHSFYHFQKRQKPGTVVVFVSKQGLGKSAIYGHNATGPGVMFRIYGGAAQKYSNIDQLLKDFNADSEGKLYCALEEVRPGRGERNNDQLKDKFTEGTMRVEKKGIDPFMLPDHRVFYAMSQHESAFEIKRDDRRVCLNRGRDLYTQESVNLGTLERDEFQAFCTRLNSVKNDDEVAYRIFRMGMLADLSAFDVHMPVITECKRQQQQIGECRVVKFLEECRTGEFCLVDHPDVTFKDGWIRIKPKELWDSFVCWHRRSYIREFIVPENKEAFTIRFTLIAYRRESHVAKKREARGMYYHIQVDPEEEAKNDF